MLLMGAVLGVVVAAAGEASGIALLTFQTAMILKFLVVVFSVYTGSRLAVGWTGKKFNTAAAHALPAAAQMA